MRLGRLGALTALVLAGSAGIGFYVAGFYVAGSHVTGSHVTPGASPTTDVANSRAPAAQASLASDAPESSTPSGQKVKVAVISAGEEPATEAATPVQAYQRESPAAKPAPGEAKAAQPPETENGGRIKE